MKRTSDVCFVAGVALQVLQVPYSVMNFCCCCCCWLALLLLLLLLLLFVLHTAGS